MKTIKTLKVTIRREKPVALPRSAVEFVQKECMPELYAEFLTLARIVAEGRAVA